MDKQKVLKIFNSIYGIVMAIIFAIYCLKVTNTENISKLQVLKNRFIISLIFLIPGIIHLAFKDKMLKIFYTRNGLIFKDKASEQKAKEEILYLGRYTLITAILILIFAILFYILF